jgi:two-component system, chemotaxis family, sensor kinase CheA
VIDENAAEFLEIFRDEANERLDTMVDSLLELESGRGGQEAVAALFRAVHTIKGGAAMLGLDHVRTIAHAVEDVLDSARESSDFPATLVDTLLRAVDMMRSQLAGDGEESPDLLEELDQRRRALAGSARVEEAGPAVVEERGSERRGIRVPAEKIDRLLDLVGESVLHRRRLEHVLGEEQTQRDETISDELDVGERLLDELKDTAIGMRTLPVSSITGPLPRAVRDIALAEGKQAQLTIVGAETELDRVILDGLYDQFVHLIRNAIAHGIEAPEERERAGKPATGSIELRAVQRGGMVEITLSDDGRGVPREALVEARRTGSLADVLARAGFSTAGEVSELSGRGVGLDSVKRDVESFGGSVEVQSEPGKGTAIILRLPLALALLDVLMVERGGQTYGVPLASVEEGVSVANELSLEGKSSLDLHGRTVPLADLADLIRASAPPLPSRTPAIVVMAGGRRAAAACDQLLGEEEVLVKTLGPLLSGVHGYLGSAILGDGRIALLLDPGMLVRAPERSRPHPQAHIPQAKRVAPKVLVVEDSFTVRELQRSILQAAGYRVVTARDGREGLATLLGDEEIELVLTDIEMPEMDGFELTRAIRANAARSSTPIVILTSLPGEDQQRAGLEAGADAYMVKRGFDQHALLETVERLVGR